MIKEDEINRILENLPEEELNEVYWYVKRIQKKYLFKKNLTEKGVIISELFEESQDIIDLWDRTFAWNISEEVKESIYYNQYRWHIFSYEKQVCSIKETARKEFNEVTKSEIYVMYQDSPYVMLYKNANNVVAEDFDSEQDIYIFDRDFTWTYVHTHESMCGPYYYKVK
ncbi:DUF4275 family protein [Paenibacillus sp. IHBB 10380]|uniref:DUF4275 family protein n=1 Tax=Paenibacillus sp. IHBB 10380 TaxID=1566358 RepID=UPI0005D97052|nr:DUF4275 family protein [Paenibacillus sp. IHBB 10380]AJS58557.1 hypothetical protein UB51_08705 [Paenibacillus sp. IHBB 10380]